MRAPAFTCLRCGKKFSTSTASGYPCGPRAVRDEQRKLSMTEHDAGLKRTLGSARGR
jgi:hypothetical protein